MQGRSQSEGQRGPDPTPPPPRLPLSCRFSKNMWISGGNLLFVFQAILIVATLACITDEFMFKSTLACITDEFMFKCNAQNTVLYSSPI